MDVSTKTNLMVVMLLLLVWGAYRLSLHATRDENSKFNFGEGFLDANGKTSIPRLAYFGAFVVSVWTLIVLVVTENLSEWYYTAFLGAFVLGGVANKLFEKPTGDK